MLFIVIDFISLDGKFGLILLYVLDVGISIITTRAIFTVK